MLSSDRRQAVKDLLKAALQCEPASRADFIREASHGDDALSDAALRVLEAINAKRTAWGTDSSSEDLLDDVLLDSTEAPGTRNEQTIPREFRGTSRFEVRRKLGSGGFGTVYECHDREQHQSVALKVLRRTDPAFLYRFKREFRAIVDIRHRNLVEVYELFQERQFWFFTMELVRGVSFLEHVQHGNQSAVTTGHAACNIDRLRAALLQLTDGILALHSARMLHRDIKPSNVLISADGRVRLLDFGLVRELEQSNLQSVMLVGTPAYMAPEQLAQLPYDAAADWYSLGIMMFQALTGSLPPRPSPLGHSSASTVLKALVDASDDLKQLCVDLLDADPTKRPTGEAIRERLGASRAAAVVLETEELPVGRGSQLRELTRLVELTRQGLTVVVNLHGQSGVGKSTVIKALRRRLARTDPDVVMLAGRCHETETVPFKALDALVDDLSRYMTTLPSVEAEAITPRDAASLIRVFPVLAQVDAIANVRRKGVDVVDAQELRQRAFASLQDLLARLAERRTLVIAIDDLQWGDLDSVAILRALFTGPSAPAWLFIASYRTEDVETSPFLKAWRSYVKTADSFSVHEMRLAELSLLESQELALRLFRRGTGDAAAGAAFIARESGGSPFLIEQLARYSTGETPDKAGLNLRQAFERRLGELSLRGRRLLETVAIAGQPLPESIVYAAAECDVSDRPTLLALVADHFLRVRNTNESRSIEIYHDRLRDMILDAMPRESRQQRHLNLAVALEADAAADPAVVSVHRREAGDLDRASHYAWAAGDQASNALAFERAAEWYQRALESGKWNDTEATSLRKRLAEALVFAGRGVRAAEVYLKAAETAPRESRSEFQRLAAEQLLRAGHVDEGLAVLEGIARELGIWLPSKPWQTLLSLLVHRVRAALPVSRFNDPASSPQAIRRLKILDVYRSFFLGLTIFDPIRAMDFHARHRLLAARVGDPKRLSLSLALEAANRAASGDHDLNNIQQLISKARALCDVTHSPETLGFIATMEAFCAYVAGNWRLAMRLSGEADRFLAEQCSGVAWERAAILELWDAATFYLGDWHRRSAYADRLPARIQEAEVREDVHALVASVSARTLPFLIADQPALAQQLIHNTMALLPSGRFLLPKVWGLNLQVYTALYIGDGHLAWSFVRTEWPRLVASRLLRVEHAAIVAFELRARAAIASAAMDASRNRELREALKCAQKLSRMRPPWARAFAHLIRAEVASVKQEVKTTVQLLETAEAEFRTADMSHYVAACEHRRGMSIGGEKGRALLAAAEGWARSQGIVNPSRVFNMLAPGRWEPS